MKKLICLLMAVVMLAALCACGAKQPSQQEAGEWTREGFFGDESGNMLSVTWMDLDDSAGWYAGLMLGDDIENSYGNMLQQEGNSLHGNIVPDYEEGEMIVTITEEGEDGLSLTVEGGETYHFTPMDLEEASISVTINTDGIGQFSYIEENQESDGDALWTSAQLSVFEPETIVLRAVATEPDWLFVKWTMNGEDYSTEEEITVDISESADFIAVFEWSEDAAMDADGQNPVMNFVGEYAADRAYAIVDADGEDSALISIEWGDSAWSLAQWVMSGRFDADTLTVEYDDCILTYVTYGEDGSLESEEIQYENGTGRVVFGEDGTFTWQDDQSEIENLVFEWMPAYTEDDAYYSFVTAMDKADVEDLCAYLRDSYLAEDWDTIADYTRFPVTVSGIEIKTADEFLTYMQDKTVDESDRIALQEESCQDMFFNGIGICLGSGQIWLSDPNYMTEEQPILEIIGLNGIVGQ